LRYAEAVGLTGQAAVPRVRGSVPGLPSTSGLSGLPGVPAVPGVSAASGVPGVQDYVSRTPIPSAGSYATGVSPSQLSTANPTDIVGGIEL
jgi:hypothetical protein